MIPYLIFYYMKALILAHRNACPHTLTPTLMLVLLLNSVMVQSLRLGVDLHTGPHFDEKESEQHCTLRPRSLRESAASCLQR